MSDECLGGRRRKEARGRGNESHLKSADFAPSLVTVDSVVKELVGEDERGEERPSWAGESRFTFLTRRKESRGSLKGN